MNRNPRTAYSNASLQWVFMYGSNNIPRLAERLRVPESELRRRVIGKAKMVGWKRIFTNSRVALQQGKTGVATIVAGSLRDCVLGYTIQLTEQEMVKLDEYEGVRYGKYLRTPVNVIVTNTNDCRYDMTAIAYVIPEDFRLHKCNGYVPPSQEYLTHISQTINDGGWIRNNGARFTPSDIPLNIY